MSNWLGSVLGCVGQQQVVPRLVRLVVLNAAPNGGRNYVADYNALGDVIVRAVTMPADSDQEHAQIQWQGGGTQDPGNPNDRRIVTRSAITPKGQPITIKASLNG